MRLAVLMQALKRSISHSLDLLLTALVSALLVGCSGCLSGCQRARPEQKQREAVPEIGGNQIVTPEQMREDLDYTIRVLGEVHPRTEQGFSKAQEKLVESLREAVRAPIKAQQFYLLVAELLCSMKDAHTALSPMNGRQNRSVNIPLMWIKDGLYATTDVAPFQRGDRVIAIGGRPAGDLIEELRRFIPSENEYWLRLKSADALTREPYLEALGVIHEDQVEWTVQRNGEEKTVSTGWFIGKMYYGNYGRHPSRPWVGYTIMSEPSLGFFYLDQCNWNDEYRKAVKDFFTEVSRKKLENIAVDLRWNPGGNSQVVTEFLRYLDVDRYRSSGVETRFSTASAQQRHSPRDRGHYITRSNMVKNQKCSDPDLLFRGRLYVLTSAATFSSANDFAVVVKDNQLGTIVGEPTGEQPTSCGDILQCQMPNTGFRFDVSYRSFLRPEPKNDPADALYPDIAVYTTIEDVLQDRDPQIEKVKEMVLSGKVFRDY